MVLQPQFHGDRLTLTGFELLDAEGDWWHANAEITTKNQITVTHPSIATSTSMWFNNWRALCLGQENCLGQPYCNDNANGLPAVLFQVNLSPDAQLAGDEMARSCGIETFTGAANEIGN